jgi:O-succinylbenzoate-CoA ligase
MRPDTNIGFHLSKRAELGPDLEAIVDVVEGRRLTYAELNERADRVAEGLVSLGLVAGDRVAALMPNGHRMVELYYGAAKAGLILVPMNLRLVGDEIAFILRDSGALALIGTDLHADIAAELQEREGDDAVPVQHWLTVGSAKVRDAIDLDALIAGASGRPYPVSRGDEDAMFIMYTSGTTGRPKGAVQTHTGIEWSLLTTVATNDMRYRDRYLLSMPLFHIAAFNVLGTMIYRGGAVVIMRDFTPESFWSILRDEKITMTLAVPAMLNQLLQTYSAERHQPLELRWIVTGASPVPTSLIESYASMGMQIFQGYGLTEAGGVGCMLSPEAAATHVGSVGKPLFHTEAKVVDRNGQECPADVAGELLIRGRHVMRGYWNQPEQTAATLRDGWVHTGDIARRDSDGFVYIVDRVKDMIVSGGENVFPAEIEQVLHRHPQITDVAVIGVPSQRWGESPMAVVVRADASLDETDVISYCDGRLARFKLPKVVRFVDELPRNATGKILKRELRAELSTVSAPE